MDAVTETQVGPWWRERALIATAIALALPLAAVAAAVDGALEQRPSPAPAAAGDAPVGSDHASH